MYYISFILANPIYIIPILIFLAILFLRQINQYQRGVMFTLGKFTGIKEPGWRVVVTYFSKQ